MTTTITIHPAGHRVEVITTDQYADRDAVVSTVTLEPGSAAHSAYITDTRSIEVREIPLASAAETAEAPADDDAVDLEDEED
jgi:hypothetical protein